MMVCIILLAGRMASVGQPFRHSVQPMHQSSSMNATERGPSLPCRAFSASAVWPVIAARRATPSAPPGGPCLIAAARALRLGQRGVDPRRQIGQGVGGWRLAQALRALLRGAGVAAALAALRALLAVPGPADSAATALAGSGDTQRVAIAGAAGVLAAARGAEVVGGTASTVCAVCCAGSLPALLAGVTGTATGASAAAVVAATTAGASAFFGGDGCARMKSRTWGYTMSRQRRPLKMP